MANCKRCCLPDLVPGANLDAGRICAFCREHDGSASVLDDEARRGREENLEDALGKCKGVAEYDCVVCFSGGKDSIYLLYRLSVDYGLKVLAFTTDVNIPQLAWQNMRLTLEKLGVDHLVYRPADDFYQRIFRYCLRNQEERGAVYTVSYVYAPLFEGDALKVATDRGIPLVLAGYSPGQPEPERMLYEFSRELVCHTDWTPPELRECGAFDADDLSRFWDPMRYPVSTSFPRYLAPFHAWEYNQEEIMKKVVELGLVRRSRHASPIHTNYPITWLLMYSDLNHFGYNPYQPEFSALIRAGKASLTYWRIAAPVVNFMVRHRILLANEVNRSLQWLGMSTADLRINRPKGAYDPPVIASKY
jgi:hypothetical protein